VQALASDAVRVTGTVADVRPFLRHAALVVAPLRLARGIQNKILEAMAMERAVIAAGPCVRALDAAVGRDVIAADTADDFFRAVAGLLEDPDRAAAIGIAARARVLARYSWDAHLAGFDGFLAGGGATAGALVDAS
jgi:glycosyltransferase involved in cell wall biosynthesis